MKNPSIPAFLSSVFVLTVLLVAGPGTAADGWRIKGGVPEIGAPAPDFTLPSADGDTVSVGDFRGKVIVIAFSSCYADTCCQIVQAIDSLEEEYAARGMDVLLVCSEIPPTLAEEGYAALKERCGAGHTHLIDGDRAIKSAYKVRQLPTSFLVDRDFVIRARVRGVRDLYGAEFRGLLEELL